MPRPGRPRVQEKSKDFKGSMKRLIGNLKPWRILMVLALILAMISAVLSLIAPDKLSDLTDTITAGITPNQEKLELIGAAIGENFTEEKMKNKMSNLFFEVELTEEELVSVSKVFTKLEEAEEKASQDILLQLPDKVLLYLLDDIKVDGVIISSQDQLDMLRLTSGPNNESNQEQALAVVERLPKPIYSLIKPIINMDKIKSVAIFMAVLYIASALFNSKLFDDDCI